MCRHTIGRGSWRTSYQRYRGYLPKKIGDHQVFLHFDNATKLIGKEIPKTIKEILMSLEIKINNVTEAGIGMTIPAYRNDVTRRSRTWLRNYFRVYGLTMWKLLKTERIDCFNRKGKTTKSKTGLGINSLHWVSWNAKQLVDTSKFLYT